MASENQDPQHTSPGRVNQKLPDGSSARVTPPPLGLSKLLQVAIEPRFQAVAAERTECLEH